MLVESIYLVGGPPFLRVRELPKGAINLELSRSEEATILDELGTL